MKKIFNTFLAGISAVLPITITIAILIYSFQFIDGLLEPLIIRIFGHPVPGIGFIVILIALYIVGLFAKQYFGQELIKLIERPMAKIPIVQMIYGGVKDLSKLLTKEDKKTFAQVVKVHFPTPAQVSIGFITCESLLFDNEERVAVFIPTTPNPTNGFLVYIKPEDLTPLDLSIEQAIKMIVSMGSVSPDALCKKI